VSERLSFKTQADVVKFIQEQDVEFIAFNFTDLRGTWHVMTYHAPSLDKQILSKGVCFDGSSIAGWQGIERSDMVLIPDLRRACLDPFAAQRTLKIFCSVYDPYTDGPYVKCPRSIAAAAEIALKNSGIADTAYFGPEPEFFVFDDVRFQTDAHHSFFHINSEEGPYNSGTAYPAGNAGHRPRPKSGYMPDTPVDTLGVLRGEMITVLHAMGIIAEKHHHEVAPSQCELGIAYEPLLNCADTMQVYKFAVKNVAHTYGKSATFMPKPVAGDNGSGMHCHLSLWNKGKPFFAGEDYAGLSQEALFFIGGILKHGPALAAFCNPTVNSYKRLQPGYEAPTILAYSAQNRSASCRIPLADRPGSKRVEVRFPDPSANPYLAFAALLMAGLDGIDNKIHPGEPQDHNLYEIDDILMLDQLPGDLESALAALEVDRQFLLRDNVFTEEALEAYIALKYEEILSMNEVITPKEYQLYYSS